MELHVGYYVCLVDVLRIGNKNIGTGWLTYGCVDLVGLIVCEVGWSPKKWY